MTSSQCDPRPGMDDTVGGDARDRDEPKASPGPIKYPVRFEELHSARGLAPVLVGADCELVCEAHSITPEEASHVVQRLNMAEAAVYKMNLMGWYQSEDGTVRNARLQKTFDDWVSALDWCVGEACE